MKTKLRVTWLLAIIGMMSVATSAATPPLTLVDHLSAALPDGDLPCIYICYSCGNKHNIGDAGVLEPDSESAHEEWCQPGSCPAGHACDGGVTWAPAEFEKAIYLATGPQIRELVRRNPGRLRLNDDRGAIQVIGCHERVLASYNVVVSD